MQFHIFLLLNELNTILPMLLNVVLLLNGLTTILFLIFNFYLLLHGLNTILLVQSNISLFLNGFKTILPLELNVLYMQVVKLGYATQDRTRANLCRPVWAGGWVMRGENSDLR